MPWICSCPGSAPAGRCVGWESRWDPHRHDFEERVPTGTATSQGPLWRWEHLQNWKRPKLNERADLVWGQFCYTKDGLENINVPLPTVSHPLTQKGTSVPGKGHVFLCNGHSMGRERPGQLRESGSGWKRWQQWEGGWREGAPPMHTHSHCPQSGFGFQSEKVPCHGLSLSRL